MDESVDVEDIEKIVDIECAEAEQRAKQDEEAGNKQENESGKLGNLISSFFHHDEEEGAAETPEKDIPASAEKPEKQTDDGSSGGSSLVDSLIAKLPPSLSDEASLETEEASILIHSIVHD